MQQDLELGRAAAERRDWEDAHVALSRANQTMRLGAEDLELLAVSSYLLGRVPECLEALQRAYSLNAEAGLSRRAMRCAFWLVFQLLNQGDFAQASGWLARANHLLEDEEGECVEQGYLLVPVAFQHIFTGDFGTTRTLAARAGTLARRFGDGDLLALALNLQGRAAIYEGEPARGLILLDEAMLGVVGGELSPIVAGVVYCSVIEACQEIAELRRAHEWTAALSAWCERQIGLVTFTGQCLVHRAEIMRLRGAWPEAVQEAQRARERFVKAADKYAAASAYYQQAEVHRQTGEFSAAESAYQEASRAGLEPHPGLAMLRLAQGNTAAAMAAMRRVLAEKTSKPDRLRLLPACVEIMLVAGDLAAARAAAAELAELAELYQTQAVQAMAEHARGAVLLAVGDANSAVAALARAWHAWRELEAPYEAACVRVRLGLGRRALGDEEGAATELAASLVAFGQLGAMPDVRRVEALVNRGVVPAFGLTARELEVLRLLASGKTNSAIAIDLVVATKTVDRHVSNIFDKLGVSSRAAATAFAYEHQLL